MEESAAEKARPAPRVNIIQPTRSPSGPKVVREGDNSSLLALLKVEADARGAQTEAELLFLIANETRKLVRARQVFVLRRKRADSFHVKAVSSIDAVDRNSPLIRWIERVTSRLRKDSGLSEPREFTLPAYCDEAEAEAKTYPFANMLWVPFNLRDGDTYAGALLAREQTWQEADIVVARRLADCFSHAWAALQGIRRLKAASPWGSRLMLATGLAALLCLAIPVPLTVLAPGQIVPRDPYVVAAPIEGIVDEIVIEPNTQVGEGDLLLRLVDTTLRNELELSESQVRLAETKLKRDAQAAFEEADAKRELRLAMSELQLKQAERNYASDLLSRATLSAPVAGVAVFSSRKDWKGRPVAAGERIMEIADPGNVELEVRLPVGDSISLEQGARVKVFLDSDPLNAREATVVHVSHEAAPDATNVLSYRVIARLADPAGAVPRIGEHGTAQLFGDSVALFYYLFRRPITALRQHTGL
jgi:multidrug efflux pump subunit AcrA (membrane-fusion protein)